MIISGFSHCYVLIMELCYILFFLLVGRGGAYSVEDGFVNFFHDYTSISDSISERALYDVGPKIAEAPYMAVIYADSSFKEFPFITGVIITERWILTTAKTLRIQRGKHLKVITGVERIPRLQDLRRYHEVVDQILHANYKPNEVYNDIALVKIYGKFTFNEYRQPITLMAPNEFAYYQNEFQNRVNLTVYNYGSIDEASQGILKKTTVSVNTAVVDFTERIFVSAQKTVPACYGDTGSPAVVDGKLVGLLIIEYSCGRAYPNVFNSVLHYYDWIKSATNF